jgi:hypothetical protein
MRTAVVVVPRERFTSLPVSLRSLFATITPDVPVVGVEGGTPDETRTELQALARDLAPSLPRGHPQADVDRVIESLVAVPAQ